MINLQWLPFPGSDVVSYKVYRSIIGFEATIVPLSSGLNLVLKLNGGAPQTFTFDGVTSIVDLINATITGGRAFLSADTLSFFVRSNNRDLGGSVEIVSGTALAPLGLVPDVITQLSENFVIATPPALVDPTVLVTYTDPDGAVQDWYAISTVDSTLTESNLTSFRQPIQATGPLCVIEGIAVNLQGARVADVEVIATALVPPTGTDSLSIVNGDKIRTLSGTDGRYSLVVLQGVYIQLDIPALGFSKPLPVPAQSYIFINDLMIDTDYRFPTEVQGDFGVSSIESGG